MRLHKRHAEVNGLDPKTEPTLPSSTSQASDVFKRATWRDRMLGRLGDDGMVEVVMMLAMLCGEGGIFAIGERQGNQCVSRWHPWLWFM
jgi:hypothetical protein